MKDSDILNLDETSPDLNVRERFYTPILGGIRTTLSYLWKVVVRRKPMTVQYPEEKREVLVDNYRGFHRLNKEEYTDENGEKKERVVCVACCMCETACPVNAITIHSGEAPWPDREKYPKEFILDELRCIFCGMCEEACPCDAIELTPTYDIVGTSREEMIYDKEKLMEMYDKTKYIKPRKNPRKTGYD